MAVFRLHRKEWEKAYASIPPTLTVSKKRKRAEVAAEDDGLTIASTPRQSVRRKGMSSGLSTVVKRRSKGSEGVYPMHLVDAASRGGKRMDWWRELA
jgi:hypothetical protein